MVDTPDFEWYTKKGRKLGLPPRCPYATVETCPRYYQSLSLLGQAGSTQITPEEDERLLREWRQSDLWPRTAEYEPSISGSGGAPSLYSNFCPEVLFDRFGYFATHLARYADEVDQGVAQEQLATINAPSNDPRWRWAGITSQHFSECPLYSVLSHRDGQEIVRYSTETQPWWKKYAKEIIVGIIIVVIGGCISEMLL